MSAENPKMRRVKIKLSLGIGFPGSIHTEELEEDIPTGLEGDDLAEWIHTNIWMEWIWNYIDGGVDIIESSEEVSDGR